MVPTLRSLVDVRPGEVRAVLLTFLHSALVVAAFMLAKPIRNALFLEQYPAERLPFVYVAAPLVLLVFVPLYMRAGARLGHRALNTAALLFFLANALAFWVIFRYARVPVMAGVFYVWVNCFGIIAPVQVWVFANSVFDTRQAKRLFGLIAAGGSVGAIGGGFLARSLVGPVGGTVNLLLVLAALIFASVMVVNLSRLVIPIRHPAARRRQTLPLLNSAKRIARTRYLLLIAAVVVLVAIVTQWTQYQLHLVARERYLANADELTRFYGTFNLYLGLAALLVQLLATGPALRRLGVGPTLLALPCALAAGSAGVLLAPGFLAVLVVNALDQGLRFSVDKAAYELLFLPLPAAYKEDVKVTIDTVINRCADAVGGVLLGVATHGVFSLTTTLQLRGLAAAMLVLSGVWVFVAMALHRGYVGIIREVLGQHRLGAEGAPALIEERTTAQEIESRLGSGAPADILYALDLLERQTRGGPEPAVRALVSHAEPAVRRRALALLRERGDLGVREQAERLLKDEDLGTRTEALVYLAHLAHVDPVVRIQELGDFPDASIRAGMAAFLAQPGRFQNLEAAGLILDQMVGDRGDAGRPARLEAARLLGVLPDVFDAELRGLISDPDREVARAAMRSAGRLRRVDAIDQVLARLADPALADAATLMLIDVADLAVPTLADRLQDDAVPTEIRRQIPAVLSRIGTDEARRTLVNSLIEGDAVIRFRIISSLNKLRRQHPDAPIDRQVVEMALAMELIGHYRSHQILGSLRAGVERDTQLIEGVTRSMRREVERIFRLMALVYGPDIYDVYVGLGSASATVGANAVELLDNILRPPLRGLVMPLIDPAVTLDERIRLADSLIPVPLASREDAVVALLRSEDAWMQSCGAYAVGTLRLAHLEPELDALVDAPSPLLRETVRGAKESLVDQAVAGEEVPQRDWGSAEPAGVG